MPERNRAVRVAVLGASGYTGAELLRLIALHPVFEVTAVGAGRAEGERVGTLYPHLEPFADLVFENLTVQDVAGRADAALLALPHGESMQVVPGLLDAGLRVVDLGGDFRLPAEAYPTWYGFEHAAPEWLEKAVYGLPELFGDEIRGASLVANPGCYPTPVVLALVPVIRAGLVPGGGIVVDAKSGISGAGRTPTPTTVYAHGEGSVRPYKAAGVHQHIPEIERILERATGRESALTFVPHLVPSTRGVLVTCYAPVSGGIEAAQLLEALAGAYAEAPFVRVLPEGRLPDSKRVTGANTVEIGAAVDPRTGTAILIGCLDNLVKGAAGQALQNLNLMFGLPETAGLEALAIYP
jgi:N-acetyl-gamma-glutamyl-phosphate reductase